MVTHSPGEGPREDLGFCSLWDQNESSNHTGQSQTFPGRTGTSIENESGGAPSLAGRGRKAELVPRLQLGAWRGQTGPGSPWSPVESGTRRGRAGTMPPPRQVAATGCTGTLQDAIQHVCWFGHWLGHRFGSGGRSVAGRPPGTGVCLRSILQSRQRRRTPGCWPGRPSQEPTPGPCFFGLGVCGAWSHHWVKHAHPTGHRLSRSGGASTARDFSTDPPGLFQKGARCREPHNSGLPSGPQHSRGQMCEPDVTLQRGPGPGCAQLAVTPAPPALRLPSPSGGG